MSTISASAPGAASPVLPPGLVPVTLVKEELKWLLLETIYSAFLVPIGIVLFFFSTSQLRRQPIFILNVCAIGLGIAQGIIGIYNSVNALILNLSVTPTVALASVYLFLLVPFFVQAILILRVLAAYPPRSIRPSHKFAIYTPIILFKLGRIANLAYLIFRLEHTINAAGGLSDNSVFTVSQAVWSLPSTKVDWFLQLFDDTYVSTLFIMRIRKGARAIGREQTIERLHVSSRGSTYLHRLKTLFWIAVFNFVFPIIFNIVQLVLVFRDSNFLDGSYILYTNNYVEIIGVLLATIWAAGSRSKDEDTSRNGSGLSSIEFKRTGPFALQGVTSSESGGFGKIEVGLGSTYQLSDSAYAEA